MTLTSDLLPAAQHYALFAAALTLFSLSITRDKMQYGTFVWICIIALPVLQIAWSLWETIREVLADGSRAAPCIVIQALVHATAIVIITLATLGMVGQSRNDLPRRVRLEPTIGQPRTPR